MTKEEAYRQATLEEIGKNPNGTRQDIIYRAMDIYVAALTNATNARDVLRKYKSVKNHNPEDTFYSQNVVIMAMEEYASCKAVNNHESLLSALKAAKQHINVHLANDALRRGFDIQEITEFVATHEQTIAIDEAIKKAEENI